MNGWDCDCGRALEVKGLLERAYQWLSAVAQLRCLAAEALHDNDFDTGHALLSAAIDAEYAYFKAIDYYSRGDW